MRWPKLSKILGEIQVMMKTRQMSLAKLVKLIFRKMLRELKDNFRKTWKSIENLGEMICTNSYEVIFQKIVDKLYEGFSESFCFCHIMYQSTPILTTPPPANPRRIFLKERIPHSLGTKKVRNHDPWGRKNALKPRPRGIIFKNPAKKTKHETEVMKNSTEMLICLEILHTFAE